MGWVVFPWEPALQLQWEAWQKEVLLQQRREKSWGKIVSLLMQNLEGNGPGRPLNSSPDLAIHWADCALGQVAMGGKGGVATGTGEGGLCANSQNKVPASISLTRCLLKWLPFPKVGNQTEIWGLTPLFPQQKRQGLKPVKLLTAVGFLTASKRNCSCPDDYIIIIIKYK